MKLFGKTTGYHARVTWMAPLVISGMALSGCVSSPTYGTDKTAGEQLVGDLSSAFSFKPVQREKIAYKPRPELVKPAPGQKEALPAPQESITQTASNQWPEAPEQKRARLRAEATENFDSVNFRPQIIDDDVQTDPVAVRKALKESGSSHPPRWSPEDSGSNARARRAEINRRLADGRQGDPTNRKYLSEPPLTYRVAADSAPQNDIGEDEVKKERRLKKEAAAKGGKSGMFDWLPW